MDENLNNGLEGMEEFDELDNIVVLNDEEGNEVEFELPSDIEKKKQQLIISNYDVDENQDIANQYKIYSLPTLVVIENGIEKNRAIGAVSKEAIEDLLN